MHHPRQQIHLIMKTIFEFMFSSKLALHLKMADYEQT